VLGCGAPPLPLYLIIFQVSNGAAFRWVEGFRGPLPIIYPPLTNNLNHGGGGRGLLFAFYQPLYPLIILNNVYLFSLGRRGRGLLSKIIKTRRNPLLLSHWFA
ncbi:hypothetical protein ACYH5Q_005506, partial [Escherichia coli]